MNRPAKPRARLLLLLVISAPILGARALAADLPDRLLVGYWHNWGYSPNTLKLTDVPDSYDVVNVAFATPTTAYGSTMTFTPSAAIYANQQQFIADLKQLQAQGRKVLISIGGANDPVNLKSATDVQAFVSSMTQIITTYGFDGMDIDLEGGSLSLLAGDKDFKNPTSPLIVNFIDAAIKLTNSMPKGFMLTAAPETAFVQGGYSTYAGIWGAYLPVIHALRSRLTYVHVQHYNTGSMYGRDGKIYSPATADFHVAMADALLAGFPVDVYGSNLFFPPLASNQVLIGLPASTSAAGSGYTAPSVVHDALDYLIHGIPFGGSYKLADPKGYFGFPGLMTWSVNWDVHGGNLFSDSHRQYLDSLILRASPDVVSGSVGGVVQFSLRAGPTNGGRNYILLGGASGTAPGTPLPGGLQVLPLNWDVLSLMTLTYSNGSLFSSFTGILDPLGSGNAQLNVPVVPGHVGLKTHYAFLLTNPFDFVSNPVQVTIGN